MVPCSVVGSCKCFVSKGVEILICFYFCVVCMSNYVYGVQAYLVHVCKEVGMNRMLFLFAQICACFVIIACTK